MNAATSHHNPLWQNAMILIEIQDELYNTFLVSSIDVALRGSLLVRPWTREQVSAGILAFLGHLFGSNCFGRDVKNQTSILQAELRHLFLNNVLQGCPSLCLQCQQGCHLDLKHTYKKKEVQFRMMQTKVGFQISPETITWNESITFHSKTCKTSTLSSTIHYDHSTS